MPSYRFEYRSGDGWEEAGETPADRESTARQAFDMLRSNRPIAAGEYRFKRSDERVNHPWGYLRLDDDGTVFLGKH